MLEDLRGEMEIVNSKSEEEDDENESCDGDEGSVYDFALFLALFLPISALFFSTTSYMVAQ